MLMIVVTNSFNGLPYTKAWLGFVFSYFGFGFKFMFIESFSGSESSDYVYCLCSSIQSFQCRHGKAYLFNKV